MYPSILLPLSHFLHVSVFRLNHPDKSEKQMIDTVCTFMRVVFLCVNYFMGQLETRWSDKQQSLLFFMTLRCHLLVTLA